MKSWLLVLFVSFPLFAADEFNTVFQCRTPNMADAGYTVTVQTGGFAGITQVTLSKVSFMGTTLLGRYIVRETQQSQNKVFTGKDIKLVVGPGHHEHGIGIPHKVYNATFSAKTNDGTTHRGQVQCWSPKDPQ